MDIKSMIFMKRGIEYSLLDPSCKIQSLDEVCAFKHTPINSKKVHIFFATINDIIDSSFICPTCSGEYELLLKFYHELIHEFNSVEYNENLFSLRHNNKTIVVEYYGLSAMRNHQLKPEFNHSVVNNIDSFSITYYDLLYRMDDTMKRISRRKL